MPDTKQITLDITELLSDKFECRDIFLYPGYNCGQPCPDCKGYPSFELDDPSRCHCYNEALKKFKEGQMPENKITKERLQKETFSFPNCKVAVSKELGKCKDFFERVSFRINWENPKWPYGKWGSDGE